MKRLNVSEDEAYGFFKKKENGYVHFRGCSGGKIIKKYNPGDKKG